MAKWQPTQSRASMMQESTVTAPEWGLDQIPFEQIDVNQVRDREDLFYLVTAASFVEIASDLYTSNLIQHFEGDDQVVQWLQQHWQHEEMRHGYALRDYVQHVWPEFNWQAAYDDFFNEYSAMCTIDEFEPSKGLEMVARCVVETGTATFYTALSRHSSEPVLSGIAARIRAEEVGHYKHFYQYFKLYHQSETPSRWRVLGAIRRRVVEARNSDADVALWHVYAHKHPGADRQADKQAFQAVVSGLGQAVKRHYPVNMAAKMVLRPLGLPPRVNQVIEGPLSRAATWLLR
ncbi:MAG TPA: ferritin-like domain-containing protein [Pusillimonas sp.]|uniref:ferritin-like domain-containing protein n=1 Tax=Pusillimonas sp. TaxID=3040095 RepID=UPI002BD6FD1C|nr:ferritin-like domain-containing protein [Pusillimonas sp.]HUH87253.1 ferritin-like domain-containing protein [Pusillimonas sp.]